MNENTVTTVNAPARPDTWKGITLEELRMRRAKALLKREVEKERMNNVMDNVRTRVADNGIRGFLFSNNAIAGLKTADYALLGWRLVTLLLKLRRRK